MNGFVEEQVDDDFEVACIVWADNLIICAWVQLKVNKLAYLYARDPGDLVDLQSAKCYVMEA